MRNRVAPNRFPQPQGADVSNECANMTLSDAAEGWASAPVPVTVSDVASNPLTHRFAIRDARWARIRPIDDFRASVVNDLVATVAKEFPDAMDSALARARLRPRGSRSMHSK